MEKSGKFAFSLNDDDYFTGNYDSIEDAFSDAIDNAVIENEYLDDDEKIDTVYAGEIMEFIPRVDAEMVIDSIYEKAGDEAGEYTNGYLENVSKYDIEKLENMLTDAFNEWAKQTNNEPCFTTVENIKERKIEGALLR